MVNGRELAHKLPRSLQRVNRWVQFNVTGWDWSRDMAHNFIYTHLPASIYTHLPARKFEIES